MKNLLACLALLLLASCIPVDDLGSSWDKGILDPALAGRWDEVGATAKGIEVRKDGGSYRLDSLDPAERAKKDYKPELLRTLEDGPYKFFMVRNKDNAGGDLVRYAVTGAEIREYSLVPDKTGAWLKQYHAAAKNIFVKTCATPANPHAKCMYDDVQIRKLDEETLGILANIPDTDSFWAPAGTYRKRPEGK